MVSRSSAAGNSSIPPTANKRQREHLGLHHPGLGRHLLGDAADDRGRLRRERIQSACAAFGFGFGLGGDAAFGDQQDPENADQQDRALQEQRWGVDGDGAQHRGVADGSVQVAGQLHDRDERAPPGRRG